MLLKFMVFLFRRRRGIIKNKKLKEEVKKIDKDIKKLLEQLKKDPFCWHPKKNEECRKLIEKILKEIEEHKKSLHTLYSFRPNDLLELENIENYLRKFLKMLETIAKSHTLVAPKEWLKSIQTNWYIHKMKF